MLCRFEDRLAGRALRLDGLRRRIEARAAAEVGPALQAIEAERRQGRWVALMLDYELGEWLLPEAARAAPAGPWTPPADDGRPRLRALVFDGKTDEAPWDSPGPDAPAATLTPAAPRMAEADYLRRIDEIRDLIGAGELYQVNYTQPLDLRLAGDPATLYRRIAARNPVAHAAFIQDGERSVLSFSPELFIRRDGERLTTRPMKGTAPRHPDRTEDERLGRELLASEKNRAENLMIVDLLRNDLAGWPSRLGDGGRAVLAGTLSHGLDHDVHRLGARPAPRWKTCCARCSPAAPSPARQDRRHAPHPPDGDRAARPVLRQHRLAGAGRRFLAERGDPHAGRGRGRRRRLRRGRRHRP